MDKETQEFLTEQFGEIDAKSKRVDIKFDGLQQHISAKAEESRRQIEVVLEGLRSDVQQVVKGQQLLLDGQSRIIKLLEENTRELTDMLKFS